MLRIVLYSFRRLLHTLLVGAPRVAARVPHAHAILSLISLYVFAQAFALLWMFGLPCLSAIVTRLITRTTTGDFLMAPVLVSSSAPRFLLACERCVRSFLLVYVYFALVHMLALFSGRMWTVGWEMYHDFPTMRRMLAPRKAPAEAQAGRASASERETAKQTPEQTAEQTDAIPRAVAFQLPVPERLGRFPRSESEPVINNCVSVASMLEALGVSAPSDVSPKMLRPDDVRRRLSVASAVSDTDAAQETGGSDKDATPLKRKGTLQSLQWPKPLERPRSPKPTSRRALRRRLVLVVPLALLAFLNFLIFIAPLICRAVADNCTSWAILDSTSRVNRATRFVVFVSVIQWAQVWVAFFPTWHEALALSRSWRSRFLTVLLILFLMPCGFVRLTTWMLWPGGSDRLSATYKTYGVDHHMVDALLISLSSCWLLFASVEVLSPEAQGRSGWSIRRLAEDIYWRKMTTAFKFTLLAGFSVHHLRNLLGRGFASAQNDLCYISMIYPLLFTVTWLTTYLAVLFVSFDCDSSTIKKAFFGWVSLGSVAICICSYVGLAGYPVLVIFTWSHLCRQGFRLVRAVQQTYTGRVVPKFAVSSRHCDTAERKFARWVLATLGIVSVGFLVILFGCLLIGGVQKRTGLVIKDTVAWRSNATSIEIDNTKVSLLTLFNTTDERSTVSTISTDTARYAGCGHAWYGLNVVDYALLSLTSYMSPSKENDLPSLMRFLFPHKNVQIQQTVSSNRKWLEFEVTDCHETPCQRLTVVAVSGTDPSMIFDMAENLRMWTEPVLLDILGTWFPTIRMWPRETTAMVIGEVHKFLGALAIQDNEWHYHEILNHVRQIPRERNVVVTGHSLGGGMALVIGAMTDRLSVAINPPGVYHSMAKHMAQRGNDVVSSVHAKSLTVVTEGDWVQHFDKHGGLIQNVVCDRSQNVQLGCHMLEGTICHLLQSCGDPDGRFIGCKHEYEPDSLMRWMASTGVDFAKKAWASFDMATALNALWQQLSSASLEL